MDAESMRDILDEGIWRELGPVDPDWFGVLTAQALANESGCSDHDDLCANQEGLFQPAFDKTAAESQLFSTPKVFRRGRVASPEDESSFAAGQECEALPWTARSPHLFRISKDGVPDSKYGGVQPQTPDCFDLNHTSEKSPVSHAQRISESLGAHVHPDISWTSSLNTPPAVPSTLILSRADESPCSPMLSEDKSFVFVRKLFPSLSNASRIGAASPKGNDLATVEAEAGSPGAGGSPETRSSPRNSLNHSENVWRQKLPDAIEDGEIRSAVASVLEGAENALSIFFSNSSSALRKAKTVRIKRKPADSPAKKQPEQGAADEEPRRVPSSTDPTSPVRAGDAGVSQWSPLSLSEIPTTAVEAPCRDDNAATQAENSSFMGSEMDSDSVQLARPSVRTTGSGFTKKRRRFVYSVESSKPQMQSKETLMMDSSQGPEPDVKLSPSARDDEDLRDVGAKLSDEKNALQQQENATQEILPPSIRAKVQDFDMSQLCRAFAGDLSQMSNPGSPGNLSRAAEPCPPDGFSPSACLTALRRAKHEARRERLQPNREVVSTTTGTSAADPGDSINEGTISDSGFQSALADITHATASSAPPCTEEAGQSRECASPLQVDNRKAHSEEPSPGADAISSAVLKESQTSAPGRESEPRTEATSTPSGSAKAAAADASCIPPQGQAHGRPPDDATGPAASVQAAGFKTASDKCIRISSANLERAKRLFEETEGESSLVERPAVSGRGGKDGSGRGRGSAGASSAPDRPAAPSEVCRDAGGQLTASQRADVTELCNLLEEADSQFEFTQFRALKLNRQCQGSGIPPQKADKELDPDFLSGIDFDDSFCSEADKRVISDKTVPPSDGKTNLMSPDVTSDSTGVSYPDINVREDLSARTAPSGSTRTSEVLGFKTAGGIDLRVSEKCLSKARALFLDLEESALTDRRPSDRQGAENDAETENRPVADDIGHALHQKEDDKLISHDEDTENWLQGCVSNTAESVCPDRRAASVMEDQAPQNLKNMDTALGPFGFQMASGKGISISARALQEANAFFKDCDVMGSSDSKSMENFPASPARGHEKSLSKGKSVRGVKVSEEPVKGSTEDENAKPGQHVRHNGRPRGDEGTCDSGLKRTPALTRAAASDGSLSLGAKSFSLCAASENVGSSAAGGSSGQKDHQSGGFQTAGGKRVLISSAALKKAKLLLSECEGGEDKVSLHPEPSKIRAPAPPQRNNGFVAASGKPVAFSAEALQKAKALFGDISSCVEIPAASGTRRSDKEPVDVQNTEKMQLGFTTAGGAVVHVSEKSLLKAKNLLKEFDAGCGPSNAPQETDGFFMDTDDVSVKNEKSRAGVAEETINNDQTVKVDIPEAPVKGCAESRSVQHHEKMQRTQVSTEAPFVHANPSSAARPPSSPSCTKRIGLPALDEWNGGGGFCTASGKRVSVSDEAVTRAKSLLNESDASEDSSNRPQKTEGSLAPQNGGFKTASGKGVAVSSAALKKAKSLLGECDEVEDKTSGKPTHPKIAVHALPPRNGGFLVASGKPVAFSTEALQKARALFDGISLSPEIPADSGTRRTDVEHLTNQSDTAKADLLGVKRASHQREGATHSHLPSRESESVPICSFIKEKVPTDALKQDKFAPSVAGNLHEEENPSILDCDISQAPESRKAEEPSVVSFQSLNLSGCTETQQRFLAQEALDCTKALLEDESLAGLSMTLENLQPRGNPKPSNRSARDPKPTGKRLTEDADMADQPPLKRRLLDEFDRTLESPGGSKLHPEQSCPSGIMKDRRVFKYSTSLHPNITKPQRDTRNNEETRLQTAPQHSGDNGAPRSKIPSFVPPFLKNANTGNQKTKVLKDNARTPAFVPPFKRQRTIVKESPSKPREEEDKHHRPSLRPFNSNTYVPPTRKTQSTEHVTINASKDNQTAALADPMNDALVINQSSPAVCGTKDSSAEASGVGEAVNWSQEMTQTLQNIELARDMQDMRIRKKRRQTIQPLPGSMFLIKTSGLSRISLKDVVNGKPPAIYNQKQLYGFGVHQHVSKINGETAESFRFSLHQFFRKKAFMGEGGVQLADGGWLIPSNDGTAGKEQFYRALCDTPGVDPKLISEEWVFNHYRWIVWKRASMERSFAGIMGSLCLTPDQVLLQLKYRYDVEVDHSRRPALRKIMEKDDTAAKTLVLCVCGVVSGGHSPCRQSRSDARSPRGADAEAESSYAVIWLTDGWYSIKAQLDDPLTAMLHKGRLTIGGKLIIHGAQLMGSQDACSPLEAPESLMLKIHANSSRPARWDTKLGFYRDPRPFLLPLSCLYSNGGPVGCVDIVILRCYPIQWMERKPDGGVVFRSVRAEEKEVARYNSLRQKAMETLFAKIQAEFEKEEKDSGNPRRRRRTMTRQEIASLQSGEELCEAVGDDPAYLEADLSEQQLEALRTYRRALVERKQAELQDRYRRALEDADDKEGSYPKRDATPVWRLSIADCVECSSNVYQLNLWRPTSDLQSLLKEGCRYKVYNLTTSEGKKRCGTAAVQLTGTKKTQFQDVQTSQEWLSACFQPRASAAFVDLQSSEFQSLCGEVDLTGYVITVVDAQGPSPAFYLADGKLNFVKVRCFSSFAHSGLADMVKPRVLLALSNLQLRGQSTSPTQVLYAGDLAVFSTNPKERHLQESLGQLRNLVQGQEGFFHAAEEKLSHLVRPGGPSSISSPALQPRTPASTAEPQQHMRTSTPAQPPVGILGSFTPVSRKPSPASASTGKDPRTLKRRRALEYLSHVPSPPPLSHLVSPCVNKTFNPPRRSGTPSTLKPARAPTPRPVASLVEDEWVDDEELAMIDTQALRVGGLL